MEMLSIARMARIMSSPDLNNNDLGLKIKDRIWFKILLSNSFLGKIKFYKQLQKKCSNY